MLCWGLPHFWAAQCGWPCHSVLSWSRLLITFNYFHSLCWSSLFLRWAVFCFVLIYFLFCVLICKCYFSSPVKSTSSIFFTCMILWITCQVFVWGGIYRHSDVIFRLFRCIAVHLRWWCRLLEMLSIVGFMRNRSSFEVFLFLSQGRNVSCGIWLPKMLLVQERYSVFDYV